MSGGAKGQPAGGSVVSGQAQISASGATTLINQNSAKAIINWQSFSVGQGGSVQFNQPSSSTFTLNRVTGTSASTIDGATPTSLEGRYAVNGSGLNAVNYTFVQSPRNANALTVTGSANTLPPIQLQSFISSIQPPPPTPPQPPPQPGPITNPNPGQFGLAPAPSVPLSVPPPSPPLPPVRSPMADNNAEQPDSSDHHQRGRRKPGSRQCASQDTVLTASEWVISGFGSVDQHINPACRANRYFRPAVVRQFLALAVSRRLDDCRKVRICAKSPGVAGKYCLWRGPTFYWPRA